MSENDDPFGRSDRTIIRPNPGGRRPSSTPSAAPPPEPAPAYEAPRRGGAQRSSAPRRDIGYPAPDAPEHGFVDQDMWMNRGKPGASPYMQSSAPSQPMTPAPVMPHISVDLGPVANDPLLRASASLLLLLGRLRASLSRAQAGQLMDQVTQAIEQFKRDAIAGGASKEQMEIATYALAATADDIVQNLPGGAGVWTQFSMLVRFSSGRMGGVKFFEELEKAKQHPTVNLGLLELMHACLCLGFEGVYRTQGGSGALQGIRRDLYETIRRASPMTVSDISPHWKGQTIALAGSRLQIPMWSIAALAAVLLVAVYLILRNMLSGQAEDLAIKMAAIHPNGALSIFRTAATPPPPPPPRSMTQLQRIRAALDDEIKAGRADADQNDNTIFIRIFSFALFPSGGANVNASFLPTARKIAASLDREPGAINIVGHTDSDPIKTIAFASNYELSVARAKSVAAIMKADLANPERVQVSGKGADQPLAPNDVEANKSKNRRVDISIPRADGP